MLHLRHTYSGWAGVMMAVMAIMVIQCRKPFEPVVFKAGNNYLVVDGLINTNPGGITSINLSRTANISDSVISTPEHNATMFIQTGSGASYSMTEQNNSGIYTSAALNLGQADKYRVFIKTAAGGQYQSDYAVARPAPAIDSITWKQDVDGVTVYANTHDPANKTWYYRWTFAETWQYESRVYSEWGVANNLIFHRDSLTQQVHVCWKTDTSTAVLLGSSIALSQDRINQQLLTLLPQNDGKLDIRYSILVSQYALTAEAYTYWQIIEKNTQQTGGLFDAQPSELIGNIRCLNNPNEPVIGFITAGSVQQSRLFISHLDLQGTWQSVPPDYGCELRFIFQNPTNFALFDYPDKSWGPAYFTSGGGLAIARNICMDCRMEGGVTQKPAYW